jgi:predicted esterase
MSGGQRLREEIWVPLLRGMQNRDRMHVDRRRMRRVPLARCFVGAAAMVWVSACQKPAGDPLQPSRVTERAPPSAAPTTAAPWPRAKAPRLDSEWCIAEIDTLDRETCFVLPSEPTRLVLIYFHGIVPPGGESPEKTNYQTVVANAARRAGVAALMPRGRQGLAPKGQETWWGWPTTEASYSTHAAALVDSISVKRKELENIVGVSFSRVYVAGSSSGAYFVAALALHGGIEADGFAVLSGGAGRETPELMRLQPKPFYIGYGTYDSVKQSAQALAGLLRRAGWPVRVAEHPLGHGAREIYLDEAFEFFRDPARSHTP